MLQPLIILIFGRIDTCAIRKCNSHEVSSGAEDDYDEPSHVTMTMADSSGLVSIKGLGWSRVHITCLRSEILLCLTTTRIYAV